MKSIAMNSTSLRRSQAFCPRIAVACVLFCTLATVSANAQSFYSNVPDFYQHQKFGPGNNAVEDPNWEVGAFDFGWCFHVSTVNQFFFFKKKGYSGLLINDATAPPPKWLPAVNDEIKAMVKAFDPESKLQKDCQATGDPKLQDTINCILADRGAGPQLGINGGLIHQYFEQIGTAVQFISSDATNPNKRIPNTTLFAEMQKYLNAGDSVNLRVGNLESKKLWWAGPQPLSTGHFHSVTVAGFDNQRIWFTDPDSNPDHNQVPGNRNTNAGWFSTPDQVNCGADGKLHTNLACIRLRRFMGNEQLPVATNKPPTQKERDQRYFVAVMQLGFTSFNGNGKDFDRYDGTDIVALNLIEIVKGAAKGGGGLSPDGENIFEVTPGDYGATPIDEFWVFPAFPDQMITSVDELQLPSGWRADVVEVSGEDLWGNYRPYGWVHAYTEIGDGYNPLYGKDVLDMPYDTQFHNPLTAWDVMFGYQKNRANLRVQVLGASPPQEYKQVGPNN